MNTYTPPAATVGSKWTPEYRKTAAISADIRRDLKVGQRDGTIPVDLKISVRFRTFAGGRAINVTLTGWDDSRIYAERENLGGRHGYTPEALAVYTTVERIREALVDHCVGCVDYGTTNWR